MATHSCVARSVDQFSASLINNKLKMHYRQTTVNQAVQLSASELQAVSRDISNTFSAENNSTSKLVILPVDPVQLYTYWKINETFGNDNLALVLRIYWLADGLDDVEHSKLWFDTILDVTQGQRKINLPVDDAKYSAAIGLRDHQHNLDILVRSQSITTPRINAKPIKQHPYQTLPTHTKPRYQSTLEFFEPRVVITSNVYDEMVIDKQIREIEFNQYKPKNGIRKNMAMAKPKPLLTPPKARIYDETIIDALICKTFHEKGLEFNFNSQSINTVRTNLHYAARNPSGQNSLNQSYITTGVCSPPITKRESFSPFPVVMCPPQAAEN